MIELVAEGTEITRQNAGLNRNHDAEIFRHRCNLRSGEFSGEESLPPVVLGQSCNIISCLKPEYSFVIGGGGAAKFSVRHQESFFKTIRLISVSCPIPEDHETV